MVHIISRNTNLNHLTRDDRAYIHYFVGSPEEVRALSKAAAAGTLEVKEDSPRWNGIKYVELAESLPYFKSAVLTVADAEWDDYAAEAKEEHSMLVDFALWRAEHIHGRYAWWIAPLGAEVEALGISEDNDVSRESFGFKGAVV